jgi:hypothetical protein
MRTTFETAVAVSGAISGCQAAFGRLVGRETSLPTRASVAGSGPGLVIRVESTETVRWPVLTGEPRQY